MIFNARSACAEIIPFINAAQFDLIRLLSHGQTEGLFVVGDDDQSIYSWRGGSPEFIRGFKRFFGDKANYNDTQDAMKLLELEKAKNASENSLSFSLSGQPNLIESKRLTLRI